MKKKTHILTGKDLLAFEDYLDSNTLFVQNILGIYAPTLYKMHNEKDVPIDRLTAAIIRFVTNNTEFTDKVPLGHLRKNWDLLDLTLTLTTASPKNGIKVKGKLLNPEMSAHIGVLLMRGYTAARRLTTKNDGVSELDQQHLPTRPVSIWIGFIIYAIENKMPHLIEKVIDQEIEAHGTDVEMLLRRAWPSAKIVKPTIK
ncbi:MAG: hypothetical protein ACJAS1_003142 [Oleiphilaceae bacterium]|jgi:hypothetical protein